MYDLHACGRRSPVNEDGLRWSVRVCRLRRRCTVYGRLSTVYEDEVRCRVMVYGTVCAVHSRPSTIYVSRLRSTVDDKLLTVSTIYEHGMRSTDSIRCKLDGLPSGRRLYGLQYTAYRRPLTVYRRS